MILILISIFLAWLGVKALEISCKITDAFGTNARVQLESLDIDINISVLFFMSLTIIASSMYVFYSGVSQL